MITLVCKVSGYQVTGDYVTTTEDHYVIEINGITQLFKITEWEEKR